MDDGGELGGRRGLHEPQVELDDVGLEERHERERAAVGADVVERDRAAELAQALHGSEHVGRAVGERALRELDDEPERVRRLREQRAVAVGDGHREQARLGVDEQRPRPPQPGGERAAQRGGAARPLEVGEPAVRPRGAEQPVRELERRAGRAARERLVADDRAGLEVDDRLVDALDALRGEQAVELGARVGRELRRAPRRHARRGRAAVTARAVAALVLGGEHRGAGVPQQRLGAVRVLGVGADADAGRHGDGVAGHEERRPQDVADAAAGVGPDRRGVARDVAQDDDELVAADPREHVAGPHHGAQAVGHLAQEVVARALAERRVRALEVVEVDREHGDLAAAAGGRVERDLHPLGDRRPVRQPGERVVGAQVLRPLLGRAPFGDVGLHAHVLDDAPAVRDGRDRDLVPERRAVAAVVAHHDRRRALLADGRGERGRGPAIGVRALEKAAVAPDRLLARVAREPLEAGVDVDDRQVRGERVDDHDPVLGGGERRVLHAHVRASVHRGRDRPRFAGA